jgi:hypothetical protein
LGDTRRLAIVRATCSADPENVPGVGAVDAVLTPGTQRRRPREPARPRDVVRRLRGRLILAA